MWTGSLHCQQDVYLLLSIHLPPVSFIYTHIRHIWFPLRVQNMTLEWLVLGVPLLSPPLHCPLELQQSSAGWSWGGVSWLQAQCSSWGRDTHEQQALSSWVSCLCPVLADHMRPSAEDESDLHVFPVIKQFYLVMLKSLTWILQLCHDGAGNAASQLTAASVCVISAVCCTDWGFLRHKNRPP